MRVSVSKIEKTISSNGIDKSAFPESVEFLRKGDHWAVLLTILSYYILLEYDEEGVHCRVSEKKMELYRSMGGNGKVVEWCSLNHTKYRIGQIFDFAIKLASSKHTASNYNAKTNNCQSFVRSLVKIHDPSAKILLNAMQARPGLFRMSTYLHSRLIVEQLNTITI